MTASSLVRFDIEDAPSDADVEVLPNGLEAFNESKWPGHQQWRPLAVFARDGESIVAGLAGETYSGWLFIRYLWVSDALRGQGIGRKLMGDAEARALARGCHSAWVDTFSFQAPGFYPKLGYQVFGELDYPPGHKRIFLQKRLAREAGRRKLVESDVIATGPRDHCPSVAVFHGCAILHATQSFQPLRFIFLQLATITSNQQKRIRSEGTATTRGPVAI
jgi:GNAT superfamily N-acetyltransferase